MGSKQQTYATVREALAIIANARLSAARGVADPDRYHARILSDLRATLHDQALAILEDNPDITPADLAAELDASTKQRPDDPPSPSAALPLYEAQPWEPLDPEEREVAMSHLNEIRSLLHKHEREDA